MAENGHKVGVGWPSWRYPPDGGPGQVFQRSLDVPPGWLERPVRKLTAEEMIAAEMRKTTVFMPAAPALIIPEGVTVAPAPRHVLRKLRVTKPVPETAASPWPAAETGDAA